MTTPKGRLLAGRRTEIETELTDKYGVKWTYFAGVPTNQFDIDKSLKNQARFESIDEKTVSLYQEGVERGDPFPAVLAYRPGRAANPPLVIIDGNHRLVAHDRAGRPVNVYEIDRATKPQAIAIMTFAFNTKHGRPTTEQERLSHALYLVDNGASLDAAGAAVNVPMADLRRAYARANADKRADEVGVDRREWEALTAATRQRLLTISTDEGFHGAVHLAYKANLGADDIQELTTLLNTSKSSVKQRKIISSEEERFSDRIQASAGGAIPHTTSRKAPTVKARVRMMLGQILALPDDLAGIARGFADSERGDASRELVDASEKLRKLALILDPTLK